MALPFFGQNSAMENPFFFELQSSDPNSNARAGCLHTPHARIETPVFMPVGTQATVKSLSERDLTECGCSIILANTYHLHLRPGDELIAQAGGLHRFEHWNRALLTDSGGFQVFSLRDIAKIGEDGVWFQSYIDGSKHFFSPERVITIQRNIGADIIMMFDECPAANAERSEIEAAVDRTLRWAGRCIEHHAKTPFLYNAPQALFGIVQGAIFEDLRSRCSRELVAMDCPGYAIGGLAVGETTQQLYDMTKFTCALLPETKPRYCMGVGMPDNILECIERGIDMFDCVLPTRNARNGSVFTWSGQLNLRNARFTTDFDHGIDKQCECYACRNFSRAYLRHLVMAGEILAIRLLTLHNVYFYMDLVRRARKQIIDGTFSLWKKDVLALMKSEKEKEES
jgi:queuine tRNA-ribosyltransferase